MPTWVKVATDAWTSAAGVVDGYVFRPVNRAGQAGAVGLSEKVVWQVLQPYSKAAGVPGIAPHDLRRYAESRIMPNRWRDLPFGGLFRSSRARAIRHDREGLKAL